MSFPSYDNNLKEQKSKVKQNIFKRLFIKLFGFEANLDLTDQIAVLKRKNEVIKNIIFILNFSFFIMMLVYSTLAQLTIPRSEKIVTKIINWIIMGATFPTTFIINYFLKKLIKKQSPNDNEYNLTRQQTAMYMIVLYLFIAPLILYIKINFDWERNAFSDKYKNTFETISYLMFYFSFLICAFYQDKKVILNASLIMFAVLALVHFLLTHNFITLLREVKVSGWNNLYLALADLIMRYIAFMLVAITLYALTSMSNRLQTERRNELIKRKTVETDFTLISNTIITSIKILPPKHFDNQEAVDILTIANKLGLIMGLDINTKKELEQFALIHLDKQKICDGTPFLSHNEIKEKAILGTNIIRRVQISQLVEQNIRNYLENNLHVDEVVNTDLLSNILFISELYYRLRSPQDYKEPFTHSKACYLITNEFSTLVMPVIKESFLEYSADFNALYLNL